MSKKRGLSLEEKREKMLRIFYQSQDFFLRERERLGPASSTRIHSCARNQRQLVEIADQCNALKKGREESEKYNELKDEMAEYADNDPAAFEAMKNAILVTHAAANRWTDHIFTLIQRCSNNFPEVKEQLEHMYQEVICTSTDTAPYLKMSSKP
ncbi:hypothetical protein ACJRO7_013996 [Eucalyptus globulus]|uniref:Leucine zipper with capping helix domain-containing protein n=1 Tax=Eucalyptus globulus TaxID=34317 RepID=A0ABD3L2P0_EUCGL